MRGEKRERKRTKERKKQERRRGAAGERVTLFIVTI